VPRSGDVIENPVTGERLRFVETAADSGGERLRISIVVRPGGSPAVEHIHRAQEERFRVESGRIAFRLRGREEIAEPGTEVTVPPGQRHFWWNAGDTDAEVSVELRPALRTEEFFDSFFRLAREGKTDENGLAGFMQAMAMLRELGDSHPYLVRPPIVVQRTAAFLLSPVARLLGRPALP
jgi:mannose-6-phosphate isomerase-like protein (cupin superfamily)